MKFLYHGKSLRGEKRLSKFPHYLKATVYGNANNEINDVNVNKTKKTHISSKKLTNSVCRCLLLQLKKLKNTVGPL